MKLIERQPSKFLENSRMLIITDTSEAETVLRKKTYTIPNLYRFLENLENASGESLEMTRCFVNVAPFFLENERHQLIRKLALEFFHHKNLANWEAFISYQINDLVSAIPKGQKIDLVQVIAYPLFDRIGRPLLGVYPNDYKAFDRRATVLQKLVEPMQSIRKLKLFEEDVKLLVSMLREASNKKKPEVIYNCALPDASFLEKLLDRRPLDETSCYALSIAMFAALAPLVQTTVNMLALIISNLNGKPFIKQDFLDDLDYFIHLSTAPKYIHRIANENNYIGDKYIKEGTTILIDIQKAFDVDTKKNSRLSKHFSFGVGTHFCIGAQISKKILKELIPIFFENFPNTTIVSYEIDVDNSIAYAYKKFIVSQN
ncbi:hypothetical protein B6N13_02160 [Marinomonas sp. UCMA 3892]|uniref:cytochrome P450 n=1 Tax=Marinomonas sp. UCMA 3892 TaxID=1972585 RepID=UPI00146C8B26|nr:cytochrome P450 [Marinomonas sp. UCMA 3892]NLU96902.1 hypothetical protein [Marinomonas sp. UCMA 3892]